MFNNNPILAVDSYKASQFLQNPSGLTATFSYLEARLGGAWDRTVFVGLQVIIAHYIAKPITQENIDEAADFFAAHGEPFNRAGWEHILKAHGGHYPVRIRAVPEGSVVPINNALMLVETTDPVVPWIGSWVETALMRVWYPITVATLSYHAKLPIVAALEKSSDSPDPVAEAEFKVQDFGGRGVSSGESAALGGMAHLVNFQGSDTIEGVLLANKAYGCKNGMAGFSIPASEHSTMTAWGKGGELEAYRNMIKQFAKPGAPFACVSDSYDLWNAIENLWGGALKQEVIDSGATLIIRPDSGDPVTVVVKSLRLLDERFGSVVNSKGYKVLNHVRVIQGDGINVASIPQILDAVLAAGFSATNIAFGMGGGLLQQVNRDTLRFAYKCSAVEINGEWVPVSKDPVTDPGKRSKAGRLALVKGLGGSYTTVPEESTVGPNKQFTANAMETVYENGKICRKYTFDEVRANARAAQ